MRILTYNIHGALGTDRVRDYARIGAFLKKQDVDIILIQELDTRSRQEPTGIEISLLMNDHFKHFVCAPTLTGTNGWYGNALLSKYPIVRPCIIDITAHGREPRNILEAFVETPAGLLHVINTHKGLRASERGYQIKKLNELLARKSEVPLIVGGDINEWHTASGALKALNEALHPIPAGPTFPTRFPVFHLDRLWCRPMNLLRDSKVLKTFETRHFSDHFPLMAEIDPLQLG